MAVVGDRHGSRVPIGLPSGATVAITTQQVAPLGSREVTLFRQGHLPRARAGRARSCVASHEPVDHWSMEMVPIMPLVPSECSEQMNS